MTTVVYIAGSPRSGTTLLARLLAELPDCATVGELRLIWDRSFKQNWACGCGEPFDQCPYWTRVVERWKRTTDVDVEEGLRVRNALHTKSMGHSVNQARRAGAGHPIQQHIKRMDALYEAIAAEAGVGTIIDSSKAPADALALAAFSSLDIRVVHLVRDPRGIVQSWTKRKPDPSLPGGSTVEAGLVRTTVMWLHLNSALWRHRKGLNDPLVVKYEDLSSDPGAEVNRIATALGLRTKELALEGSSIELAPMHTMAGNPMRFDTGATKIRTDDEWRTALPRWKANAVYAVTGPLLRALGR